MFKTNTIYRISVSALLAATLVGCATQPGTATTKLKKATTQLEKAKETGATVVERDMINKIGAGGLTVTDTKGSWISYYGPDGRKVVHITSRDETNELKWRTNDSGEFCEQNYSEGSKETCGNPSGYTYLKFSDGSIGQFDSGGKKRFTWKETSGNPNNF